MAYRLLADVAMVAHFGFLAFLAVGGFLAWRWPRVIWAHLAAAAWAVSSLVVGQACPLTAVEDWARRRAGEEGLTESGFIDHYLEDVVYPGEVTPLLQASVAVVIVVSYVGSWRRRRGSASSVTPLAG